MATVRRCGSTDIPAIELDEEKQLKPKENAKRKRSYFKEYIADYLTQSNLHGLKYIGEKERTYFEKVFWFCVFVCCFILCGSLIRKLWIKWTITPVIVTFSENPTPVWQIPYPAVTVCFEMKSMQRKFNFTEYYHLYNDQESYNNLTEEERTLYEDISLVCDNHLAPSNGRKFVNASDTVANIREVSPNITEAIFGCKWQDVPSENCSQLIFPILTDEGLCYTYNTLSAEELFRTENLHKDYKYLESDRVAESWSLDKGYAPGTPTETYPHRGSGYGVKSALTLAFKSNVYDQDYLCRGPIQGVKILLHNPAELPRLSQKYFRAPLAQTVVVSMKPKMVTTSEGLRSYAPERRQCYFPFERYLRYFKVYTQNNCETECLANFTYTRCGCVEFGIPHGPNMPVCGPGSLQCLKKAEMELITIEVQSAMDSNTWDEEALNNAREVAQHCKCLPACTSIDYEAETSQAYYDWDALFKAFKYQITDELVNVSFAQTIIYFKSAQFITFRRSELYGVTEFLASCGGLLGLFMGFSIMSLVEIIYFLTLRPCCLFRRRQNRRSSESSNNYFSKSY